MVRSSYTQVKARPQRVMRRRSAYRHILAAPSPPGLDISPSHAIRFGYIYPYESTVVTPDVQSDRSASVYDPTTDISTSGQSSREILGQEEDCSPENSASIDIGDDTSECGNVTLPKPRLLGVITWAEAAAEPDVEPLPNLTLANWFIVLNDNFDDWLAVGRRANVGVSDDDNIRWKILHKAVLRDADANSLLYGSSKKCCNIGEFLILEMRRAGFTLAFCDALSSFAAGRRDNIQSLVANEMKRIKAFKRIPTVMAENIEIKKFTYNYWKEKYNSLEATQLEQSIRATSVSTSSQPNSSTRNIHSEAVMSDDSSESAHLASAMRTENFTGIDLSGPATSSRRQRTYVVDSGVQLNSFGDITAVAPVVSGSDNAIHSPVTRSQTTQSRPKRAAAKTASSMILAQATCGANRPKPILIRKTKPTKQRSHRQQTASIHNGSQTLGVNLPQESITVRSKVVQLTTKIPQSKQHHVMERVQSPQLQAKQRSPPKQAVGPRRKRAATRQNIDSGNYVSLPKKGKVIGIPVLSTNSSTSVIINEKSIAQTSRVAQAKRPPAKNPTKKIVPDKRTALVKPADQVLPETRNLVEQTATSTQRKRVRQLVQNVLPSQNQIRNTRSNVIHPPTKPTASQRGNVPDSRTKSSAPKQMTQGASLSHTDNTRERATKRVPSAASTVVSEARTTRGRAPPPVTIPPRFLKQRPDSAKQQLTAQRVEVQMENVRVVRTKSALKPVHLPPVGQIPQEVEEVMQNSETAQRAASPRRRAKERRLAAFEQEPVHSSPSSERVAMANKKSKKASSKIPTLTAGKGTLKRTRQVNDAVAFVNAGKNAVARQTAISNFIAESPLAVGASNFEPSMCGSVGGTSYGSITSLEGSARSVREFSPVVPAAKLAVDDDRLAFRGKNSFKRRGFNATLDSSTPLQRKTKPAALHELELSALNITRDSNIDGYFSDIE